MDSTPSYPPIMKESWIPGIDASQPNNNHNIWQHLPRMIPSQPIESEATKDPIPYKPRNIGMSIINSFHESRNPQTESFLFLVSSYCSSDSFSLVICHDGSSNEFDSTNTNVIKLFQCIDMSDVQLA